MSFLGLVQNYSDKKAAFFESNALVVCPVRVMWLNLNTSQRSYLTHHGYILLCFFSAGSRKTQVKGGSAEPETDLSWYGLKSSDVMPSERVTQHTIYSSSQKRRISALSRAVHFFGRAEKLC